MSDPTTSRDTPSATSSRESVSGLSLYVAPDGRILDPSGQAVAPASLSPRQAKVVGLLTNDTSGPRSTGSSSSVALESSLVSRLRVKLQSLGSTLYKLTWKPWVMPSGHSRFRLRASVRRTSETERTGWVTPTSRDHKDSPGWSRNGMERIGSIRCRDRCTCADGRRRDQWRAGTQRATRAALSTGKAGSRTQSFSRDGRRRTRRTRSGGTAPPRHRTGGGLRENKCRWRQQRTKRMDPPD